MSSKRIPSRASSNIRRAISTHSRASPGAEKKSSNFSLSPAGEREKLEDFFSAPGEARECVEIARRMLELARDGMRFDDMAVLLRSPATYCAPLEDAFR